MTACSCGVRIRCASRPDPVSRRSSSAKTDTNGTKPSFWRLGRRVTQLPNDASADREGEIASVRLIVFGATGKTGQHVCRNALARSHDVTAFTRSPHKIDGAAGLRVAQGNVLDATAVADAIRGHDAVIVALGSTGLRDRTTLAAGTRHVVDGMTRHAVERLVVLSAAGVGESWKQVSLLARVMFEAPISWHRTCGGCLSASRWTNRSWHGYSRNAAASFSARLWVGSGNARGSAHRISNSSGVNCLINHSSTGTSTTSDVPSVTSVARKVTSRGRSPPPQAGWVAAGLPDP